MSFQVSKRYVDILVGVWFLYHFSYLIEKNCRDWLQTLHRMHPATCAKLFPSFSSATDEELAQLYVDSNRGGVEQVMQTVIKYSTHIAKKTNDYRRKLENERKKR